MAETPPQTGPTPVTDHRAVPRGVLPRGVQTWLMVGVALVLLLIILVFGQPERPAGPSTAPQPAQAANPDRLREYQERLRMLQAQAARESETPVESPAARPAFDETASPPPPDPIAQERKRREYESLFAPNVVLSRRPEAERPEATVPLNQEAAVPEGPADMPSVDRIADAVVRATIRAGAVGGVAPLPGQTTAVPGSVPAPTQSVEPAERRHPTSTGPIRATGPLHRVLEGTVIETVLTNRLDGSLAAPVSCLVTTPVYSHSGGHVLIPAGARVLGETKPVQSLGETRLAVTFHRVVLPDGRTHSLDRFLGLNQIGDAGLRDRVNQHYWSTFGAAGAVGLIGGLAQALATGGIGGGDGDRTLIITGGTADAAAQSSAQVMQRFLNRMPTVTIREGHRVRVYVTSDLELPAYSSQGGV